MRFSGVFPGLYDILQMNCADSRDIAHSAINFATRRIQVATMHKHNTHNHLEMVSVQLTYWTKLRTKQKEKGKQHTKHTSADSQRFCVYSLSLKLCVKTCLWLSYSESLCFHLISSCIIFHLRVSACVPCVFLFFLLVLCAQLCWTCRYTN